jgi:U6 snRNA-associated Sm-like protein LSm8
MSLRELEKKVVQVVTNDGRIFVGELRGSDQALNMVLADAVERIFSPVDAPHFAALGLYVIRGESVTFVAELDPEKEEATDFEAIRAARLKPVVH